jgi:hypothetical protein
MLLLLPGCCLLAGRRLCLHQPRCDWVLRYQFQDKMHLRCGKPFPEDFRHGVHGLAGFSRSVAACETRATPFY